MFEIDFWFLLFSILVRCFVNVDRCLSNCGVELSSVLRFLCLVGMIGVLVGLGLVIGGVFLIVLLRIMVDGLVKLFNMVVVVFCRIGVFFFSLMWMCLNLGLFFYSFMVVIWFDGILEKVMVDFEVSFLIDCLKKML